LVPPLFDGRRAIRTGHALCQHLDIVAGEQSRTDPDRHTQRLREISEKIERPEQSLSSKIDPQLRHFLQRRSYSKAIELLTFTDD
jgi:hypothetical protein